MLAYLSQAANFARMLGLEGQQQEELLRLYLLLHADHEGLFDHSQSHWRLPILVIVPVLPCNICLCVLHSCATSSCAAEPKCFLAFVCLFLVATWYIGGRFAEASA